VNKDPNDEVLSSYSYTYDSAGNRTSVSENGGSAVSYGYDNVYQLTSETRTGTNAYTVLYQYDDAGNRTQMVKNSVTTTYTYNNNNQLSTEATGGTTTTYSYDLNGNLVSKAVGGNTTSYTWNWRNLLLSVSQGGSSTSYEYDGDGTRISKTQNAVMTKYINDVALPLVQVLLETNNAGIIQATYNYGNDLISMKRSGANYYYHYDGLGSARKLTNSAGSVTDSYTYDSFGNLIASSGSTTNPYGFTGQQQFGEADSLIFLRARYYKPSIGRFISRDPIGYSGGFNLYQYAKNQPINNMDFSGLSCESEKQECDKDCDDGNISCVRKCMKGRGPQPGSPFYNRVKYVACVGMCQAKAKICWAKCEAAYAACIAEEAICQFASSPVGQAVIGTVIVAGVVYIIVQTGGGALILVPAVL